MTRQRRPTGNGSTEVERQRAEIAALRARCKTFERSLAVVRQDSDEMATDLATARQDNGDLIAARRRAEARGDTLAAALRTAAMYINDVIAFVPHEARLSLLVAKETLSAALAKPTEQMDKYAEAMRPGCYVLRPTSCACGGRWAWLRVRASGAEEMIGCACHFDPTKFPETRPA